MSLDVGVMLKLDPSNMEAGLRRAQAGLNRFQKAGTSSIRAIGGAFNRLRRTVFSMRTAITALFTSLAGGAALKVAANFEDLRTSLTAVTGSAENAAKAFKFIQDIAATMPLSVEQLTRSYITLKASGIEPTTRLLNVFSDAASVTTDKVQAFDAMTRIFSRGIQGGLGLEELNQIADRGLPVWDILKEKMGKTRLELSEVGQTSEGARKMLIALSEGIEERFGGSTARALENLSTKWSNFGDAVRRAVDGIMVDSGLLVQVKGTLDSLTGSMNVFQAVTQTALEAVGGGWSNFFDLMVSGFQAVVSAMTGDFTGALEQLESAMGSAKGIWGSFANSIERYKANLAAINSGGGAGAAGGAGLNVGPILPAGGVASVTKELKSFADTLKNEVRTAQEIYEEQILNINEALKANLIDTEQSTRGINMAKEAYIEASPVLSRASDAFGSMSDSMVDAFAEGKSAGESFKAWFRSFITDLIKELNRYIIRQALMSSITSGGGGGGLGSILGLASLFTGGNGLNSGAGFFGFGASQAGADLAGGSALFTPFARGGIVNSPTIFPMANGTGLMGEAGPEAVMPLKRGPDGKLGVAGGGGGTTIVIDARGSNGDAAVEAAVERGIRRAAPGLINASVQKVRSDRSRDPNFFGGAVTS